MPYYMARGVSARLGAMPLDGTTSTEIITHRRTEKFEKLLQASKLLNEKPVPFPGDEGQHRLNWLGDAPFIQVQAFLDDSGEKYLDTTKARTRSRTAQEVQALVLHVKLSDRTYISGLSGMKKSLKIEVLFNGQLCDCRLITLHDARTRVKGPHQIFAGTKVDWYAERPWVVLPPGMTPDGSFETNYKSISVSQRWHDICQALQSEARERGANEEGEIPPTATFLEALASMEMPEQVHNMQQSGGKAFGTIDVVITAGEGRKIQVGQSLMKEPKRMPDKRYQLTRESINLAADLKTLHDKQKSSDVERQSPERNAGLSDLHTDGDSHQKHESHSEQDASSSSIERQTSASLSLELAQPNPPQAPDDARYPDVNSNPSGTYQDIFPSPHMPQVHSPLWTPFFDSTQGTNILGYSNGNLALGNAAPYTGSLDAFHSNGNGPNYPPLFPHAGDIGVGLQRPGPNMLPMPYWSPQEPLQGFDPAQFTFHSENSLEASGWSSAGVQGFASTPRSVPMASSMANHDLSRWPFMPGPSSGGYLTGPLPPVGLYSVPTKPNRSTISRKKPVPLQSNKSTCVILLRKLVILGRNKAILVERQWEPPKQLEVSLTTPVSAESQPNLPKSTNTPPELIKHKATSAAISEPSTTASRSSASTNEASAQSGSGHARKALSSSARVPSAKAFQHPVRNEPSFKSSTRKRGKPDQHTAVDEPRSSLGSKAPYNPPLNQGCVIAYAENQDKDNAQGVVRPVRSEKIGCFEEDYVILATRFFVGEG